MILYIHFYFHRIFICLLYKIIQLVLIYFLFIYISLIFLFFFTSFLEILIIYFFLLNCYLHNYLCRNLIKSCPFIFFVFGIILIFLFRHRLMAINAFLFWTYFYLFLDRLITLIKNLILEAYIF
jgi:hypothetical protein